MGIDLVECIIAAEDRQASMAKHDRIVPSRDVVQHVTGDWLTGNTTRVSFVTKQVIQLAFHTSRKCRYRQCHIVTLLTLKQKPVCL